MPICNILPPSSVKKGDGNGKHKKNGKGQKDHGLFGRKRARSGKALRGSVGDLARGIDAGGGGSVFEEPGEKEGGGAMRERGSGSIFKKPGTRFWWIAYSFRGRSRQESSGSTDRKVALKLLQDRLRKVTKPNFVSPSTEQKWVLSDMLEQLRLDFERKQNKSFHTATSVFKNVQQAFEFHRVVDLTGETIAAYADKRVKEDKAARGSVNLELAYLRRGLRLMFEKKMISEVPVIKMLEVDNVRTGFIDVGEFNALLEHIPNRNVKDLVEFL
jgi:hypothetical protein